MSDCHRAAERMTPYVDGSLPAGEREALEQHLDRCPACVRAVAEVSGGRTVLRSAAARLPAAAPPPGLRSRCEVLAAAHRRAASVSWVQRLVPVAAAVGIILSTAVVVFALASRQSNVLLAQQLTLDHVKCFALFADPDHHEEAPAAEEALAGYGWHVRVPPSSAVNGVTFIGARRCLYTSGTIPHMMYMLDGQQLSLFVLPGERRQDAVLDTLGHHRSRIWSDGESTYVLVAPRDTETLGEAARYLMQQQEQTR